MMQSTSSVNNRFASALTGMPDHVQVLYRPDRTIVVNTSCSQRLTSLSILNKFLVLPDETLDTNVFAEHFYIR